MRDKRPGDIDTEGERLVVTYVWCSTGIEPCNQTDAEYHAKCIEAVSHREGTLQLGKERQCWLRLPQL